MPQAVSASNTTALTVADLDTEVNCEPRILDSVLGRHLGMARPTNIRGQIEANRAELEGFGSMHAARAMIKAGKGAKREVTAYYLTEGQALCVCALSRAPNAPQVRRALIEAFMELRRQKLTALVAPTPAPVTVRQHTRRLPQAPEIKDGRGCIMIGGDLFTFEVGRRPVEGELAVLVFADGHVGVATIPEQHADLPHAIERCFVMVDAPGPHPRGVRSVRERATVIGVVTTTKRRPVRRLAG